MGDPDVVATRAALPDADAELVAAALVNRAAFAPLYQQYVDPVHQNAAPIMIALSLMAAAVVAAVDAVLGAARRVVAELVLAGRALPRPGTAWFDHRPAPLRSRCRYAIAPTRGPPLPA